MFLKVISSLILNKSVVALSRLKPVIALLASKAGLSLQYYHKIPDVFKYLSLYSIKLYSGINTSIS